VAFCDVASCDVAFTNTASIGRPWEI